MTILTVVLWVLFALIGIPLGLAGLGLYLTRRQLQEADALESGDVVQLRFEQFPWAVRCLLAGYRRRVLSIGFTELICHTRPGVRGTNFACILVSPDRRTLAEIEYCRFPALDMVFFLFLRPSLLLKHPIGIYGLALTSAFRDHRRFITTAHAFLASDHAPLQKEYNVVPRRLPIDQAFADNSRKRDELQRCQNLECLEFSNQQDVLSFERAVLRKLAAARRQAVEMQVE